MRKLPGKTSNYPTRINCKLNCNLFVVGGGGGQTTETKYYIVHIDKRKEQFHNFKFSKDSLSLAAAKYQQ